MVRQFVCHVNGPFNPTFAGSFQRLKYQGNAEG